MTTSKIKSTSYLLLIVGAVIAGGIQALASSALSTLANWNSLLSLFSLFLLALLIGQTKTLWQAFLTGWLFALCWLTGSVWWIYVSMHYYGGMPSFAAAASIFALCLGLGLLYAACMALARKLSPAGTLCSVSFAVLWMLAEISRGYIFTGFPWAASGYAHVDGLLSVYAPWLGVYGVSGIAALIAGALALLAQYMWECVIKKTTSPLKPIHAGVGICMLVLVLSGAWLAKKDFTTPSGSIKVALLQGNVDQHLKFDADTAIQSVSWYIHAMRESKKQGAQLAVLPETAIPFFLEYMPEDMYTSFSALFKGDEFAALVGAPALGDTPKIMTNSALGFAPGQTLYRYDKYHLVPFGEFIPFGFRWFVNMMNIPLGDMQRGSMTTPPFMWQGQHIAPNICYEDIFGEELAKRFTQVDSETQPTLMANMSNIGWFGNTVAIPQHLQIARMRTLEFQRPMIRATNTGATAIIDEKGQVTALLPYYTQGVLMGEVTGRRGLTPYVWWSGHFGLLPLVVLSLLVLAFARFMQNKLSRG